MNNNIMACKGAVGMGKCESFPLPTVFMQLPRDCSQMSHGDGDWCVVSLSRFLVTIGNRGVYGVGILIWV